jgi:hypothetical protein
MVIQEQKALGSPPTPNAGAPEMLELLARGGRVRLGHADDPDPLSLVVVGILGLGRLIADGAVMSAQGIPGAAVALIAVFAASAVSSIAGFAFSALCGALLFHLVESPVHAVHAMIVCSIAIQLLSVATLWRSIDWHSLPVFLTGGVLGVPAGVFVLPHLPTGAYRTVIEGCSLPTAVIPCCLGRPGRCGWDRYRTQAPPSWAASMGARC